MSGSRVADGRPEVVDERLFRDAQPVDQRAGRACMGARDDDAFDVARCQLGLLEGVAPGPLAQRDVPRLAEALLPHLRARVARGSPAVEELGGDRCRRDVLGEQRPRRVVADEQRGRTVTAGGFVGAARQARAQVGGDHEHLVGAGERDA